MGREKSDPVRVHPSRKLSYDRRSALGTGHSNRTGGETSQGSGSEIGENRGFSVGDDGGVIGS